MPESSDHETIATLVFTRKVLLSHAIRLPRTWHTTVPRADLLHPPESEKFPRKLIVKIIKSLGILNV